MDSPTPVLIVALILLITFATGTPKQEPNMKTIMIEITEIIQRTQRVHVLVADDFNGEAEDARHKVMPAIDHDAWEIVDVHDVTMTRIEG